MRQPIVIMFTTILQFSWNLGHDRKLSLNRTILQFMIATFVSNYHNIFCTEINNYASNPLHQTQKHGQSQKNVDLE